MSDIGLTFEADSFKAFNKALKEFDKISKNVDDKLLKIGTNIGLLLDKLKIQEILRFEKFTSILSKLDKTVSSLNTSKFTSFTKSFEKYSKALHVFSKIKVTDLMNIQIIFKRLISTLTIGNKFDKGLFEYLDRLSGVQVDKLKSFSNGLLSFLRVFKEFYALDIDDKNIVDVANQLKQFIKVFAGNTGFGKRIKNFLNPTQNLFKFFKNFSTSESLNFSGITNSIVGLVAVFEKIEKININPNKIEELGIGLRQLVKVFSGNTGFLKGFKNFFGDAGIFNRLKKIDASGFENLSKLANSLIKFFDVIRKMEKVEVRDEDLKKIRKAFKSLTQIFSGRDGLRGLFDGGIIGKLSKINPNSFENLNVLARAVTNLSESFSRTQTFEASKKSIKSFSEFVKKIINTVLSLNKKISRSDLKNLSEISKIIREFNRAMPNISSDISKGFDLDFKKESKRSSEEAIKQIKKSWEISSPSRVMKRIGNNVMRGFGVGIEAGVSGIISTIRNFVNRFTSMFTSAFNRMGNNPMQGFRNAFTITLGDMINIAREASERFYDIFLGAGIAFEDQFASVLKTLDTSEIFAEAGQQGVDAFINEIEMGVREMSTSGSSLLSGLENAQERLTGIAASAAQLGIANDDILEFTETIGQLSVATDLIDEQAAFTLSRFTSITGTENFEQIGSALVALGNNFAATESEIAQFAMRIAGAGSNAGLTEANMLALSTAMAAVGLNAEAGGTAFTQIISTMTEAVADGSTDLRAFAEVSGWSADQFAQSFQNEPIAAIEDFLAGLSELESAEQLQVLDQLGLDSVRTGDLLRRLSGGVDLLGDAIHTSNQNFNEAGDSLENYNALQQEAYNRSLTTRNAINRLKNVFRDIKITLSQFFIPTFATAIDMIADFGFELNQWMNENPERTNAVLKTMGALVGALGLAFASSIGAVTAFTSLISFPLTFALSSTVGLFSGIVGLLFNPVGLIFGFGSLVIAGGALIALFGTLSLAASEIRQEGNQVADAFVEVWNSIQNLTTAVSSLLSSGFELIGNMFGRDYAEPFRPLQFILNKISTLFNTIASQANSLSNTFNVINRLFDGNVGGGSNPETEARVNSLIEERQRIVERINRIQEEGAESYIEHQFEVGDTIAGLADEHGLSVDELLDFNDMTLEDFMGNVSSIRIPVETDGTEEIEQLRLQLEGINEEIDVMDVPLQGLENNPVFQQLFGSEKNALENAYSFIFDLRTEAQQLRSAFSGVGNAIVDIFSGNYQQGFSDLRTSIGSVLEEAGDLASVISGLFSGEYFTESADVSRGGSTGTRAKEMQDLVEENLGFNVSEVAEFLSDNIVSVINIGFALAFGTPFTLAVSFGALIIDAISDDFAGMGELEENHPIIASLVELRETIELEVSRIFGAIGGNQGQTGEDFSTLLTNNFEQTDIATQLGSSLANVSESLGMVFATIFREAGRRLPELIEGFATFAWNYIISPFMDGIVEALQFSSNSRTISESIQTLLATAFGMLVIGNTMVALITGSGLPVAIASGITASIRMISGSFLVRGVMSSFNAILIPARGVMTSLVMRIIGLVNPIVAGIAIGAAIAHFLEEAGIGEQFRDAVAGALGIEGGSDALVQRIEDSAIHAIHAIANFITGIGERAENMWIGLRLSALEFVNSLGPIADALNITGFDVDDEITRLRAEQFVVNFDRNIREAVEETDLTSANELFSRIEPDNEEMRQAGINALSQIREGMLQSGIGDEELQDFITSGLNIGLTFDEIRQQIIDAGAEADLRSAFLESVALDGVSGIYGDTGSLVDEETREIGQNLLNNIFSSFGNDMFSEEFNLGQSVVDSLRQANEDNYRADLDLLELINLNVSEDLDLFTPEQLTQISSLVQENLANAMEVDPEAGDESVLNRYGNLANNIIDGLSTGLEENQENVNEAMTILSEGMQTSFEESMGIDSPSKVFQTFAAFVVKGFAIGIENNKPVIDMAFNVFIEKIDKLRDHIKIMANFFALSFQSINRVLLINLDPFVKTIRSYALALEELSDSANTAVSNVNSVASSGGSGATATSTATGNSTVVPRKFGGEVRAGSIYEILEDNLPFEIFETNGRNFFIPNTGGNIRSPLNSDINTVNPSSNTVFNISVPVKLEAVGNIDNVNTQELSEMVAQRVNENISGENLNDKLRNNGVI